MNEMKSQVFFFVFFYLSPWRASDRAMELIVSQVEEIRGESACIKCLFQHL